MTKDRLTHIVLLFLSWRLGLALIGVAAPFFLEYKPSFPYADIILAKTNLPQWLFSWGNFDGVHYLTIAEHGYDAAGLIQAFFPLYPLLVRVGGALLDNYLLAGVLIANLCFLVSLAGLYRLLRLDWSESLSLRSLAVLLVFPTSLYFGALYSESLFLLVIVASFFAARTQHWALAGIMAALASATRIVGIWLVPALLIELWLQTRPALNRQALWTWLVAYRIQLIWIILGSAGLLAYMTYLQVYFGDPFHFKTVQSGFGAGRQDELILFPQVVWRQLKILLTARPFDLRYLIYVQELVFSVGAVWLLLKNFRTIRWSYLLFCLGAVITPTLTGTFSSMPRYVLVAFPLCVVMAEWVGESRVRTLALGLVSLALLVLNTLLFIQGYWVA